MTQHFSNPQIVAGDKAIAHKTTNSVTLGDGKVKNFYPSPLITAHKPTDTTPGVPPEVLELESKVLELESKVLELQELMGRNYAAFRQVALHVDVAIALNFGNLPFTHKLRLARDIAKQSYSDILAINSRVISGEDDGRGSGR
ncbi:MAG: hypothetical protein KFF72_03505 [Arthrospira sp. SH-MAG29]|nr:hypothetical protein [Arthrospira sp. SH-MAG29]MBS0015426.1 hypothetical protein [Arthrospira sp. SH-MAG29]